MVLGIPKRMLIVIAILVGVVLIYIVGADKHPSQGAEGGGQPGGCRVSVTADILNVRAGPSLDAKVVGQFEHRAQTDASQLVKNGYRKIADGRWASDKFLDPVQGSRCG